MKKVIYIKTMGYLSLILVLTFVLVHNIYLVFIGISLAIYVINEKYINDTIDNLYKKIFNDREIRIDSSINRNSHKIELIDEDINFSLVEKVEESGIIPTLSKDHDDIAA